MSNSQTQVLTPEEVVFRTNSDENSIVLIFNDKIVYAFPGTYGGYVIRGEHLGIESPENVDMNTIQNILSNTRAFFVEPKKIAESYERLEFIFENIEKLSSNEKYRPILEQLELIKREMAKLPEEVATTFHKLGYIEVYEYTYVEVTISVKKITKRSIVIDVNPKPYGLKVTAKAIRIICKFACRGCGTEKVRNWKLKYPENEYVQRYIYDIDDRIIAWKIIVDAPSVLVPAVAPATPSTSTQQITPVLVNGFLVISSLPSKALLDAHLPEIFKDIKIGRKEIKLVMGYFYNKLGSLSRKFYSSILPAYAIDAGFGYIVPKSQVDRFLQEVELLKKEYMEYERQLKDFLLKGIIPEGLDKRCKVDKKYFDIVMEYLKQHGKDEEVRKRIESLDIVGRVKINLLPFAIDMRILYEFADERVRQRLEQELQEFRSGIYSAFKEKVKEIVQDLQRKLEKVVLPEVRMGMVRRAREEVEVIEKMARELGIEVRELEALKELLTPERVEELAVKTAEGRLRALVEF